MVHFQMPNTYQPSNQKHHCNDLFLLWSHRQSFHRSLILYLVKLHQPIKFGFQIFLWQFRFFGVRHSQAKKKKKKPGLRKKLNHQQSQNWYYQLLKNLLLLEFPLLRRATRQKESRLDFSKNIRRQLRSKQNPFFERKQNHDYSYSHQGLCWKRGHKGKFLHHSQQEKDQKRERVWPSFSTKPSPVKLANMVSSFLRIESFLKSWIGGKKKKETVVC